MVRFEPFAGLRYEPALALDEVIAPPYDVVGPDERRRLAERSRVNSIHLELPVEDGTGADRYTSAAKLLDHWVDHGVLRRESGPAFYPYRMTDSAGRRTTGVIGALACEPPGGDVLPHEQTIPKDMTDRLELLRACRTNLSPIWGLSMTQGLAGAYSPSGAPDGSATDDDGVLHEIWVIEDPSRIEKISEGVARSPVVIADGHHRYETAVAYQKERREADSGSRGGQDLVMALIVELGEEQLEVGPIHRLVGGTVDPQRLLEAFGELCAIEPAGRPNEALVAATVGEGHLALFSTEELWRLRPSEAALEKIGSDLDSSLVAEALAQAAVGQVAYAHDPEEALNEVRTGAAVAGVLLRAVSPAQISTWARDRRKMPPKSTYFHPKPRTGMVFRPLDGPLA